jgi:hypothetical protein
MTVVKSYSLLVGKKGRSGQSTTSNDDLLGVGGMWQSQKQLTRWYDLNMVNKSIRSVFGGNDE